MTYSSTALGYAAKAMSPSPSMSNGAWDVNLTQRLRVLLHSIPLSNLRKSEVMVDEEFRHYDFMALALKIFDLIIDRMGLEREVTSQDVGEALRPLLVASDMAQGIEPKEDRHAKAVAYVLGGLRNDRQGRRPFSENYTDFSKDPAVRRTLEFRQVTEQHAANDRIVLRLSNEIANLYLSALNLDIEDAQAATEAVVKCQLARGKFGEAVESAKAARAQSVRYFEKIMRVLAETKRDLSGVDWRVDVPKMLDDALHHIQERQDTERNILSNARDRQESLSEGESALQIAEIIDLMKDCQERHAELHGKIMSARNVFLTEQQRQAFAARAVRFYPDFLKDILQPILSLDQRTAEKVVSQEFHGFWGGYPSPVFSLAKLVTWQLQPKREYVIGEAPLSELELEDRPADLKRWNDEDRERALEIIESISGPMRLSELMESLCEREEVLEILTLLALERFASEGMTRISVSPDGDLDALGFHGDDLLLTVKDPQ